MSDWPTRLRVSMEGANRADLMARLELQAAQFFGDQPYRLTGKVDVDVLEAVRSVAGKEILQVWEGTAYFESMP